MKREIAWDLSEIFPSVTDPSVQKAMNDVEEMAEKFASKYRGKIKDFTAKELLTCLQEFEAYYAKLREILLFSGELQSDGKPIC